MQYIARTMVGTRKINYMGAESIIIIIALILSIVIHEVAHGHMANWLGDPTARLQGRLTLNPISHIDPLGSVIIPALLFFSNAGFLFGWAKPVPYNPYNLSDQRYGEAKVAAAGPAVNLLLAFIFGTLIRLADTLGLPASFLDIAGYIVFINVLLALFNMIPIPPLDGSKIILALLPYRMATAYRSLTMQMERYGFIALFIVLFLLIRVIWPYLFTGVLTIAGLFSGLSAGEFVQLLQ